MKPMDLCRNQETAILSFLTTWNQACLVSEVMGTSYKSDNFIGSRETGCPRLRTMNLYSVRRGGNIVKSRRFKMPCLLNSWMKRWRSVAFTWGFEVLRREPQVSAASEMKVLPCRCMRMIHPWYWQQPWGSFSIKYHPMAWDLIHACLRHSKLALESLMTTTSYGRIKLGSLNPSSDLAGSPCQRSHPQNRCELKHIETVWNSIVVSSTL